MKVEKKRRNAVARVMAAENKNEAVIAEARRLGVSSRTIERWVAAAEKAQAVGQSEVSETVSTPEKPAENPVLEKVLEAEGAGGKPADGPITQDDVAQAASDAEKFCVDVYAGARSAAGSFMVSTQFTPPLDATSPEVLKMLKMSSAAELAIRANAPRLYPILMRYASNWGALLLAVGIDALGMVYGLSALAKSKGWVPAPKRSTDRPAPADVPSEREYAAQLRPVPPASGQEAKGQDTVVNAPLPTPEQIEAAATVRTVLAG